MQDAAMQDRRQNERAKLWIFRDIAKWRRWWHATRLMAMTVIMDSRHRFSKRWHVADVKNITGDDQATLMVYWNSANIACTFRFYVCAIATVVPLLMAAAVATHPHRHILTRWHVADVKNFTGDEQATLAVDRNSTIYVCLRLHDRNERSGGGSAADDGFWRSLKRHVAVVKNIVEMTRINRNSANTKIYAYEIKQNV